MNTSGGTTKKRELVIALYQTCNLPRPFWNTVLRDCGPTGMMLREYVQDAHQRAEDIRNAHGMWVHGEAGRRVKLFAALAREMTLAQDGVYYTTLTSLHDSFQYPDGQTHEKIRKAKALFVSQFQDTQIDFPFERVMRGRIETMLLARVDDGLRNYLSSDAPMYSAASWWTRDFQHTISASLRVIDAQ